MTFKMRRQINDQNDKFSKYLRISFQHALKPHLKGDKLFITVNLWPSIKVKLRYHHPTREKKILKRAYSQYSRIEDSVSPRGFFAAEKLWESYKN